ncbi:hypothetical protein Tco_0196600 [Tanacetum coccineum]
MKTLYTSIKSASPSFKVDERMIWGEISGLPLYAWGSNAFKKVACMFGKFMFFGAEESTAMSSGRVCVSTRSHKFMSEKVHVEVHGETFEVQVHELGTWSISITNTSLDTSSHIDMNDIKKVVATVEENSVDDLNDLRYSTELLVSAWSSLEETNDGRILRSHEKLPRNLKLHQLMAC